MQHTSAVCDDLFETLRLAAFLTKGPSRHITQVVQHLGGSIQERLGRQHREEDVSIQIPLRSMMACISSHLQDDTLGLLIDKVPEGYHDLRTISLAILLLSVGGVQTSTAVRLPFVIPKLECRH